jgi:Ca2+/Na+ antiporter
MKPHSIGRALGIGMRVAGRIAGQRLAAGTTASPAASTAAQNRAAGQTAGRATGSIARGIGGFLRPFRRVGGMLWLEVMGAVFFLPVVVFSSTLWRTRASYAHGPDHRTFLVTAGIVLIFLYLSASSFWRARRR